jgi:hypothetical protein
MCRALLLVLLTSIAAGAEPAAGYGHALTPDDARAGWISLFDGTSTFGWTGAAVREGALSDGATTSPIGPLELRADVATGGDLTVGGRTTRVAPGILRETFRPESPAPIRLGHGLAVRSLSIRPLKLAPMPVAEEGADWKVIPHPSLPKERQATWRTVERDGKRLGLRATGGPGAVEFPALQGDFVLQLEVNCLAPGSNAGVFFRSRPGNFLNGYEAQVFNAVTYGDPPRQVRYCTGAIDDHRRARRLVSRDGEPFTLTIVAAGPQLATWVNGVQVADWTDDRPPHDNPRQGLRTAPGTIQLQAHDRGTDVEFTNIRVAPLK